MFCLLVSPDPLRRALLLSDSDSEQPSPARQTVTVGDASPTTPAAASHQVAVDIPDEEDSGAGDDPDAEELKTTQYISPVLRAVVRTVFVAYTVFEAPVLVKMAFTRSNSFLPAVLVVVLVVLTVLSLFMATLRVYEDEDREREEADQGLDA